MSAAVAAAPTRRSGPPATLRIEGHSPATLRALDSSRERRAALEQELDRVNGALLAEQAVHGKQLNWLMLSQALLVNAYLVVLVLGWSEPLPAKRWLLAGLAAFGAAVAVLSYLLLRGGREATQTLRQRRRDLEFTLYQHFQRPPVFVSAGLFSRGTVAIALRLLPMTFIGGWIAITLYTLGAPALESARLEARAVPASTDGMRESRLQRAAAKGSTVPATSKAATLPAVAEPAAAPAESSVERESTEQRAAKF
ncbi:MAG TPA: hypothetical protein VFR86_17425 [Burkholderiaceae bacterium]|nr:hypothetical protein [Burkholderiaceae bacterium]